jgi:pyridinium-3,5-bisthiocarboxylic acid mononucleotide nickel chelatase
MRIHLDAVGGVAGDMFIAAVTDAFPHLREGMLSAVRAAGVPDRIDCRFEPHRDHALTGSRFIVNIPVEPAPHGIHRHSQQQHTHRNFADLRAHLLGSTLSSSVKAHVVGIFTVLATAEGKVHGMAPDDVSFHELGEWDSIADIVGAAFLIDALGAEGWTVGTLPLGAGFVQTAHGRLPVPVPATAEILQGYAFVDDGLLGERITPTGAAILRHLGARQSTGDRRPRVLRQIGYGFGTRVFPNLSNVLRVSAFEPAELGDDGDDGEGGEVAVLAFEVDDQTPEDLAIGLDRIRAFPGVLDVLQTPAFGKKGRLTAHIQVLAEPGATEGVIDACFLETTTIGLRHGLVRRRRLPRDLRVVQVGNHAVRVKVAQRPEARTAKAEADDMQPLAGSDTRSRLRRAAEDAGLANQDEEPSA